MRAEFALVCLVAFEFAGDDPKSVSVKDELARHQGIWRVVSMTRDGQESAEEIVESIVRIVEGTRVVWKRDGKSFAATELELFPNARPREIDVIPEGGPNRDQRVKGIYKLEDGELTICMADPNGERPKEFSAGKGEKTTLMRFHRAEAEK